MNGWQLSQLRKKRVKTWQLLLALVLLVPLSAYLLRQNNLKMVALRDEVIAADKRGSGTREALEKLNAHIFHHMNTTTTKPIELVEAYNRQIKAATEASKYIGGPEVYAQATDLCKSRGIPETSLAQCAVDYIVRNNLGTGQNEISLPDKNLFTYSFVAPHWTPDAAGLCVLLTGVVSVWLLARLIEFIAIRLVLRRRIRSGF